MNKSAGRSAFIGNTSLAPQGASTIKSFCDRPEPENVPLLPTGDDATDAGRPVLLAGEGAELPLKREAGGNGGPQTEEGAPVALE